jgi:hypothetical protein
MFAYIFMSWLARPEKERCDAEWECPNDNGKQLADITTEDKSALKKLNCQQHTRNNEKVHLGNLDRNNAIGVYWVEVGKESRTCKVDAEKIPSENPSF